LRPDAKSQVTLEYTDDNKPVRIDAIVVSTQHDDFDTEETMLKKIKQDILEILIPRLLAKNPQFAHLFKGDIKYHINPTGKFVIGGPHGDTGLTGRKIIVDTYGGRGAHGGGAFSGKDPSKVDRSAAYATRHIAKNLVAAGVCDEALVQREGDEPRDHFVAFLSRMLPVVTTRSSGVTPSRISTEPFSSAPSCTGLRA